MFVLRAVSSVIGASSLVRLGKGEVSLGFAFLATRNRLVALAMNETSLRYRDPFAPRDVCTINFTVRLAIHDYDSEILVRRIRISCSLADLVQKHFFRARRAARWPHIPCTPGPGGVEDEQRNTLGIEVE